MDGAAARTTDSGRLTASTVVIQHVKVHPSRFKDVLGANSPYTETIGTGTALVLRDGKGYSARWTRPTAEAGTTFTTPAGRPLSFAPGQTWIVLTGT